MATLTTRLLHRHLLRDCVEVMEIASQQGERWVRGSNKPVIRIGDRWLSHYAHVPHALLFDMWSARAEIRLRRERHATMRLLRADITFRSWESRVETEGLCLSGGERSLVGQLIGDFIETLEWVRMTCDENGMVGLLLDEYDYRLL